MNTKETVNKKKQDLLDYEPKWQRAGQSHPPRASDIIGTGGLSFTPYSGPGEITTTDRIKQMAIQGAFGFGMGMFVGSSVVFLHSVTTKNMQGIGKRMLSAGLPFGTIFMFGSMLR